MWARFLDLDLENKIISKLYAYIINKRWKSVTISSFLKESTINATAVAEILF